MAFREVSPKDPFPGYRLFPQGIWGLCGSRTIYNRFEMLSLFWTYFNIIRVTVLGFINIFIFKNIYFRNMFLEIIYFGFVLEIKILIKPKTDLIIILK